MAGTITKTPDFIFRPARRLIQQLAPGTSILTTASAYEVCNVAGSARGIVRCKFTQAGTLSVYFIGPDTGFTLTGVSGPATVVTQYATNQPTAATLVANTENFVTFNHNGEGYIQIVIANTSGSTGTVTFCDVACI